MIKWQRHRKQAYCSGSKTHLQACIRSFSVSVADTCRQGSVLACSTSQKLLPAHSVYLGNLITYLEFAILPLHKAFLGELCENVTWFLLRKKIQISLTHTV